MCERRCSIIIVFEVYGNIGIFHTSSHTSPNINAFPWYVCSLLPGPPMLSGHSKCMRSFNHSHCIGRWDVPYDFGGHTYAGEAQGIRSIFDHWWKRNVQYAFILTNKIVHHYAMLLAEFGWILNLIISNFIMNAFDLVHSIHDRASYCARVCLWLKAEMALARTPLNDSWFMGDWKNVCLIDGIRL